MVRSDEAEWWFNAVYEAVQEIPRGRVTSYGHIARLLGKRKFGFHHERCCFYCWIMLTALILSSTMSSVNMGFLLRSQAGVTDIIVDKLESA